MRQRLAECPVRFDVSHRVKSTGRTAISPCRYKPRNFSGGTDVAQVNLRRAVLADHRLAIEWVSPVYQDIHGVQMEREDTLMIGWQKTF